MAELINVKLGKEKDLINFYELQDEFAEYIHNSHNTCGDVGCIDGGGHFWNEADEIIDTLDNDKEHYADIIYDFMESQKYHWNESGWVKQLTFTDMIKSKTTGGH